MSFLAFTFAVAVGFTLGWRTRLMSILLYLCMLSLYHRNVSSNGGPDAVPAILTFYMMLCPCGAAYSLDARRAAKKRGTAAEPLIVPWALRLLQMQICLIYFQSTIIKCQGPLWLNGTTVHYILFLEGIPRVRRGMARQLSARDQRDDAGGDPVSSLRWRSGSGSSRRGGGRSWRASCCTWGSSRSSTYRVSARP